jgi:hypothetical protein
VTHRHRLVSYFRGICTAADYCLVASGEDLVRLDRDGTVLWRSAQIAIDGVVVHDVTGDMIRGEAEWDPPGGWTAFEVSLASGRLLKGKC